MKTTKTFSNTLLAGLATLTLGLSFSSIAEAKPVLVQRGSHGAYTLVNVEKTSPSPKETAEKTHGEASQEQANTEMNQKQSGVSPSSKKIITRGPNGAAFIVY